MYEDYKKKVFRYLILRSYCCVEQCVSGAFDIQKVLESTYFFS